MALSAGAPRFTVRAGQQEARVDRLEEHEIHLAAAHEIGHGVDVVLHEEVEHALDDPKGAEQHEHRVLAPAGDAAGAQKQHLIKDDRQRDATEVARDTKQEITTIGKLRRHRARGK